MSNTWFPDPGYGTPDATPEELAAEPDTAKGLRLLNVVREFMAQDEYPLCALKITGKPLIMMHFDTWNILVADDVPEAS